MSKPLSVPKIIKSALLNYFFALERLGNPTVFSSKVFKSYLLECLNVQALCLIGALSRSA